MSCQCVISNESISWQDKLIQAFREESDAGIKVNFSTTIAAGLLFGQRYMSDTTSRPIFSQGIQFLTLFECAIEYKRWFAVKS